MNKDLQAGSRVEQLPFVSHACERRIRASVLNTDSKNTTFGIYPKNGSYAAVIGFQRKLYHLGLFSDYEEAVETRKIAEELLAADYQAAYDCWNALPDYWKEEKPFSFIPLSPVRIRSWIRTEKRVIHENPFSFEG